MNKTFPRKRPSDDEAIAARAAAWLAQRDGGMSDIEEANFARWRAADERHVAAVARLETAWRALQQLRDYRPTARAHPDRDLLAPPRRRGILAFPGIGTAAALAAALALAVVWHWPKLPLLPPRAPVQTYTTTVGGYQRLTLDDGTIVELNDNSSVSVSYTARERRVQLVRGEAHFSVTKNKIRPFFVETSAVTVRAVGTAFDVRLSKTQVEVLVTEGRVQLNRAPTPGARQSLAPAAEPPTLDAGWRAVIPAEYREALTIESIGAERIRDALSWQGPRLVFVETPLATVISEFNRRNQVQLSLGDPALATIPVGGSFRAENVEAFVRLLASNGDIAVERPEPDRIVLRKAR